MITFKEFFAESNDKPVAPGVFLGWQVDLGNKPMFELFNLNGPFSVNGVKYGPGVHTLTRRTLEKMGFYVPPIPHNATPNTPIANFATAIKTEAKTKHNPFGYKVPHPIKPKKTRIPQKAFKHTLPAKPKKKDLLKPRRWQVNRFGQLIKLH